MSDDDANAVTPPWTYCWGCSDEQKLVRNYIAFASGIAGKNAMIIPKYIKCPLCGRRVEFPEAVEDGGMLIGRRRFLAGLGGLVAAPAVARAQSLMPVRAWRSPRTKAVLALQNWPSGWDVVRVENVVVMDMDKWGPLLRAGYDEGVAYLAQAEESRRLYHLLGTLYAPPRP